MIFSYNWLQTFFKTRLPEPAKLAEALSEHAFEIEEVKQSGKDWVIDISVLPNRGGDCLSHLGIAREISAILGLKLIEPGLKIKEDKTQKIAKFLDFSIKDKRCLRYTSRVLTGVKVGPSPAWLKEKLETCGLNSINNIVDAANYVMLELGQPLHAFAYEKISENKKKREIIVKAAKKEEFLGLDQKVYQLDETVLAICDPDKTLAIAGIKGGALAGIDDNTTTIVLESANFLGQAIRQTSQKLNLKTDASWRFEHKLSPSLTDLAANRLASLIQEIAGGKIVSGTFDYYPSKPKQQKIVLEFGQVQRLLGIQIPSTKIIGILQSLGFKILAKNAKRITVLIPLIRIDVSCPQDLIEEIGRIYGYRNIKAQMPEGLLVPARKNNQVSFNNKISQLLKGLGFSQVYTYSFISQADADLFDKSGLIELLNPMSSEFVYMRPNLTWNMIKAVKTNSSYFDTVKLFEIGNVFNSKNYSNDLESVQSNRIACLWQAKSKIGFKDIKSVLEATFKDLGIRFEYKDNAGNIWQKGSSALVVLDNKTIGIIGKISEAVTKSQRIAGSLYGFEIQTEYILEKAQSPLFYQPISKFPESTRDVSLFVLQQTKIGEVLDIIQKHSHGIITNVSLFDQFVKDSKKSLGFRITYQSQEKTLTSQEIDQVHSEILKDLEKNQNWQVRK